VQNKNEYGEKEKKIKKADVSRHQEIRTEEQCPAPTVAITLWLNLHLEVREQSLNERSQRRSIWCPSLSVTCEFGIMEIIKCEFFQKSQLLPAYVVYPTLFCTHFCFFAFFMFGFILNIISYLLNASYIVRAQDL
jgi:hypothetical protein